MVRAQASSVRASGHDWRLRPSGSIMPTGKRHVGVLADAVQRPLPGRQADDYGRLAPSARIASGHGSRRGIAPKVAGAAILRVASWASTSVRRSRLENLPRISGAIAICGRLGPGSRRRCTPCDCRPPRDARLPPPARACRAVAGPRRSGGRVRARRSTRDVAVPPSPRAVEPVPLEAVGSARSNRSGGTR